MQRYRIEIKGTQPLLLHADDIAWADTMDVWSKNKDNKAISKAGDDRSPAWRWVGYLYHDNTNVLMPTANIMSCLMGGGAMVPVPGGKNGKTFKSQTQSGLIPTEWAWPLFANGSKTPLPAKAFLDLVGNGNFAEHEAMAAKHGFSLFMKRAKIGSSKHVRVRPRLEHWHTTGEMAVIDDQITQSVLMDILSQAGKYKGLGDWRPGGRTPGPFGTFEAKVIKL